MINIFVSLGNLSAVYYCASVQWEAVPRLKRFIRRILTTKARVHAQGSSCGICGGQSDNETGFSPRLPCQRHYTAAPYLLMYHVEDGQ
jgi:hypothetical protein